MQTYSKEELLNLNLTELENYTNNLKQELKLSYECLSYIKGNKSNKNKDKRKEFLKDISINTLIKIAPKSVLDPADKQLGDHQKNTGVYLWQHGYMPEKLLGIGYNGVVWKCSNGKAVKVTCNRSVGAVNIVNAVKEEIEDSDRLKKIVKNNSKYTSYRNKENSEKTIKPEKYLSISKNKGSINSDKHIFESNLAEGDFSSKLKSKMDIEQIIKSMGQVLKGLKVIHDNHMSHNDVKPDNLLSITKANGKSTLQLADFGAMTNINKTYKMFVNSKFSPPDWYNLTPAAVDKRDVYALGATFLIKLLDESNQGKAKELAKELYSKGEEYFYEKYNLQRKYCIVNSQVDSKKINQIFNLLTTIRFMIAPSYKQRITVDEALNKIQQIKAI